jgi:predicted nucleotidyltransferase
LFDQDDLLSHHFRTALQLLSASASGQLEPNLDEFVVAEKIKKYLVRAIEILSATVEAFMHAG